MPTGLLLFGELLGHELLVLSGVLLVPEHGLHLLGLPGALALEHNGGNEPLDLGGLGDLLSGLVGELPLDNKLADVIILAEVEELPKLGGTLGAKADGSLVVSKSRDILLSPPGNDKVEHGDVVSNNASTYGRSL